MSQNYHITDNNCLEAISIEGLIPKQGLRSNLIGESKIAVFYSKGYEGVIAMFFMMIERFLEYQGSEGDIHIDIYDNLMKMVEGRGNDISEGLKDTINREKKIVDVVNLVRGTSSWKEFLGEGVCLKINNLNEENTNLPNFTFYNCWTTSDISPENLVVIALKNRVSGEMLTSKYDIINYFISKTPLEKMKTLLYDNDSKESKRESHLLWQIMSKYYSEVNDSFENYDIVDIPLALYLNEKIQPQMR